MVTFNIKKFISSYKKANTFIVEVNEFDVLIIDLGNYPINDLLNWLDQNNKKIVGLILTHEHADHCYGVDLLKSKVDFPLLCSEQCEINMRNPKKNFSRYIEEFKTFGVESDATTIKDNQILNFGDLQLTVMETPGHSPGSICLFNDHIAFTGDTLLNNVESPLSFPNSDKSIYVKSKKRLLRTLKSTANIFPGHGESFYRNKYRLEA